MIISIVLNEQSEDQILINKLTYKPADRYLFSYFNNFIATSRQVIIRRIKLIHKHTQDTSADTND
jgi:hypothetical protein